MCQKLLSDVKFHEALLQFDRDLAEQVRREGCPVCRDRLHRANYRRKPRGHPEGLSSDYDLRLSLCCSREGCRKRQTPPSVRFLGRRIYLGIVVVLARAMEQGMTRSRVRLLREELGVSRRTLQRWRQWWQQSFPKSRFWKVQKARFSPPVDVAQFPRSLLERFESETKTGLFSLLQFLSPMTIPKLSEPAL